LVYAYLLQGLGLLIRKPARLAISLALIQGLLSQLGQPPNALMLVSAIALAWFIAWIVLQHQGIELFVGIGIARLVLAMLILRSPDAPAPFPTVLQRTDASFDAAGAVVLWVTMILFYGICFGLPWRRVTEFNGHD
jgi:hypothetical protein